jgi:hypothetical protein
VGGNTFVPLRFATVDLRISRQFCFDARWKVEFIANACNLFNRFNPAGVSPLCDPLKPAACCAGELTASLDPRQFRFALEVN